jgi:hypothetical protein
MSKDELIEALEAGDFGEVEFFELALDAGLSVDEIGLALQHAKQLDCMKEIGA